jgi:RNA polymerase sigma-70 factor (sigma-E family)
MRGASPAAAESFDDFVAARSAALRRLAVLLLGDPHLAEDAVQTALLKAWRRWGRIGGLDNVEAYVRTVLLNTVRSDRRRRLPVEAPGAAIPEGRVPDGTETVAERDALWRSLRALPPRQRAVLVMRFYEDMTEAQTAAALGCRVGTVKSYTARAMAALRADEAVRAQRNPVTEVR